MSWALRPPELVGDNRGEEAPTGDRKPAGDRGEGEATRGGDRTTGERRVVGLDVSMGEERR